jgi:hypothetical protein
MNFLCSGQGQTPSSPSLPGIADFILSRPLLAWAVALGWPLQGCCMRPALSQENSLRFLQALISLSWLVASEMAIPSTVCPVPSKYLLNCPPSRNLGDAETGPGHRPWNFSRIPGLPQSQVADPAKAYTSLKELCMRSCVLVLFNGNAKQGKLWAS